ncbi:hypothetical protein [Uliginosibacterium gangwonense]|uniref:hypothetical protein n=1 Tax=Uliginosibacterium gangwonense TaxID=392736 RepID=UPI00036792E1|nr:hypothetical protein [Uliginosibacterium gangwonense]
MKPCTWQIACRTLILAGITTLTACTGNAPRDTAQTSHPGSQAPVSGQSYFFQVLENKQVSVQYRTDSSEACLKMRQNMLVAAEKSAPGRGAKEMTDNLVCAPQPSMMSHTLASNADVQFASRAGCEHYAIVKGLMPPRPMPGAKPVCVPVRR